MPGPPRKPTKLRLLQGNPGKRALPQDEPMPEEGAPPTPKTLRGAALAKWKELVADTMAIRVLTKVDGHMLEVTAAAYDEWLSLNRTLSKSGVTYKARTTNGTRVYPRPEVAMRADAWRRYCTGLAHFGLSPSSRGKVQTAKPPENENASKARKYFGG